MPLGHKYLILSLSGIGNYLMHTPVISAIKKNQPDASITIWLAPRASKILAKHNPDIDTIIVAPIKRPFLLHFSHIIRLARRRFNTGLMLSPGQRWKGAAYMFLAGVPRRLGHRYPHLGNPDSTFLLNQTIPEDPTLHDIEQNLILLSLLNLPGSELPVAGYAIAIPAGHQAKARATIKKLRVASDQVLIGLHPGSAPDFLWKRWPMDNFAILAKALIRLHKAHLLIFGGAEEIKLKKNLRAKLGKTNASLISQDLLTTAAIMKQCRLFISNDSGLMHLAAAAGAPTVGLFGPTNEVQTGPRGLNSYAIRAPGTKPAYNTETNYSLGPNPHVTLQALKPPYILNQLSALSSKIPLP